MVKITLPAWLRRRSATDAVPASAARAPGAAGPVGDRAFMDELRAAQLVEATPRANGVLVLMALALLAAIVWASTTRVDVVARSNGRVIPEGREQVIASLEGGLLSELRVREGELVRKGQPLAQIDPTRFESQQAETEGRRLALQGTLARLRAEANGRDLRFPPEVAAVPRIVEAETESFEARRRALQDAVATTRRSQGLLARELDVAEAMASKGLMSEVEVMRVRRQMNDLQLQAQERVNRFRQEATNDLVRVQTELAQLDEQLAGRADVLRRTLLTSPVNGRVKVIRTTTVGGVIAPGAPIMEITPTGQTLLVEARILPADIGFVRVGQKAEIKLATYDFTLYGAIEGTVEFISPDALGDPDRGSASEATYYRALIRSPQTHLVSKGRELPVMPGMTATVEILTHERTVMSFLLRPMLKSKEAFRES